MPYRVEDIKQIGSKPHYAAIQIVTINIPGDERSRTNPGHGYLAHTETYVEYLIFSSQSEVDEWVAKRRPDEKYQLLQVTPISVSTKTVVNYI